MKLTKCHVVHLTWGENYFWSRISHASQQQAFPDLICSSWEDQFSPVLEGWKKVQREHLLPGLKLRTCQRGTQPGMTCGTNRSSSKRKRTFSNSEEEAEWLYNYQMKGIFQNAHVLSSFQAPLIYTPTMYLCQIMRKSNWNKCPYCGLT